MLTIKDFTPEIQAKIPEYIKKYTQGIDNGERYNKFKIENAEKLINWNYEKCNYKKPVIIVAENIYEAQIFFNFIVANKEKYLPILNLIYCLKNNLNSEIKDIFKDLEKFDNTLYNKLDNKLNNTLHNTLRNTLRNTLNNTLHNTLHNTLDNTLNNTLRNTLDNTLNNTLNNTLDNTLDNTLNNTLDNTLNNTLRNTLNNTLDNTLNNKLNNTLNNKLDNKLNNTLDNTLDNKLNNTLNNTLDNTLNNTLNNTLRNTLDNTLNNTLDNTLDNTLHNTLNTYNNSYLFTSNIYSNVLLAWWKFIKDEFNIDCGEFGITLDSWNDLYLNSGIYSAIFSELLCVVSKYPKKIYRDSNNNLHNNKNLAVDWGYTIKETEFNCYYIHGRNIDKLTFEKAVNKTITRDEFLNEKNEDKKAAIYEIIGEQEMMKLLNTEIYDCKTIVHNNGDLEEIQLIKTKNLFPELENKPLAWVKFTCPSTRSNYHIATNPDFSNALEAAKFHRPFNDMDNIEYKWDFRS